MTVQSAACKSGAVFRLRAALAVVLALLQAVGTSVLAATQTYTYDDLGRLHVVETGDGQTISYTLDAAGNRLNVTSALANSPGKIGIASAGASYAESQGSLTVLLRRTTGKIGPVAVSVSLSFGNASAADVSISPATVSWADLDSADKPVTITFVDDSQVESTETFNLNISAPTNGATLGSPASIAFSITDNDIPDTTPPTVPASLNATSNSSSVVHLTWNSSTDTGGSALAYYKVYRNGVHYASAPTSASGPSYDDLWVSGMVTYTYRISALDNAGNESAQSAPKSIAPPDTLPPSAPTNLVATALSGSTVRLTWTASTDAGGSGLQSYRIYRGGAVLVLATVATTYDDTTVANTTYNYTVTARDNVNLESAPSNTATVSTPNTVSASVSRTSWYYASIQGYPAQPLPPPVVVTASGGAGGYTYIWERVSGDTQTSASTPASNSTQFNRTLPMRSADFISIWRCRVTDSAGAFIYSPNVIVEFVRENGA